jgi:hypothetical protein
LRIVEDILALIDLEPKDEVAPPGKKPDRRMKQIGRKAPREAPVLRN